MPHLRLFHFNGQGGIHDGELKFRDHLVVLLDDSSLEHLEALLRVLAELEVHAGFVVLEAVAAVHQPLHRHFQGNSKIKHDRGLDGVAVKLAHPLGVHPAHHVAREGRVNVAVTKDHRAGLEQRDNVALHAVREIRGVDQAEGRRREHLLLLAALGNVPDQGGGVPLAEHHAVTLGLQPLVKEHQLGGFPGPIDPLDDKQLSREPVLAVALHSKLSLLRTPAPSV